jgi:hypothetical protein
VITRPSRFLSELTATGRPELFERGEIALA